MVAGRTIISEEVFVELVKIATAKVENVVTGAGQKNVLAAIAKSVAEKVAPQIHVKKSETPAEGAEETAAPAAVSFDIKLNIIYGHNIPETVGKVREAVKEEVERITGYQVEKIDILVEKLVKQAETEAAAE